MIGRKSLRMDDSGDAGETLRGFDDFELRLGDTMRGERATMGKSLLDVQRELRIKAAYIAAIENSDPSAFDTPGFIAGYVRSYARYLGMDPDEAFAVFCEESGFSVAHGMSEKASVVRKAGTSTGSAAGAAPRPAAIRDPFTAPSTPFVPGGDSLLSQIELRAVGSVLVLALLLCGIGYGGWSVLKEVQQVQVAPVEQAPVVLSDLDPLAAASRPADTGDAEGAADESRAEALDRLYRPQALDVPVLVARDAPISTLDPRSVGTFAAPDLPQVQLAEAERVPAQPGFGPFLPEKTPQVLEPVAPSLRVVAVRPSWVRIRAADGTVIFEGTMQAGDSWEAPMTEEPPTLRTGESGAIYFAMNDTFYGPVGEPGAVTSNLPLAIASLQEAFPLADMQRDQGLVRYAEAQGIATAAPEAPAATD